MVEGGSNRNRNRGGREFTKVWVTVATVSAWTAGVRY